MVIPFYVAFGDCSNSCTLSSFRYAPTLNCECLDSSANNTVCWLIVDLICFLFPTLTSQLQELCGPAAGAKDNRPPPHTFPLHQAAETRTIRNNLSRGVLHGRQREYQLHGSY